MALGYDAFVPTREWIDKIMEEKRQEEIANRNPKQQMKGQGQMTSLVSSGSPSPEGLLPTPQPPQTNKVNNR